MNGKVKSIEINPSMISDCCVSKLYSLRREWHTSQSVRCLFQHIGNALTLAHILRGPRAHYSNASSGCSLFAVRSNEAWQRTWKSLFTFVKLD